MQTTRESQTKMSLLDLLCVLSGLDQDFPSLHAVRIGVTQVFVDVYYYYGFTSLAFVYSFTLQSRGFTSLTNLLFSTLP